jgi:hypothetical protein
MVIHQWYHTTFNFNRIFSQGMFLSQCPSRNSVVQSAGLSFRTHCIHLTCVAEGASLHNLRIKSTFYKTNCSVCARWRTKAQDQMGLPVVGCILLFLQLCRVSWGFVVSKEMGQHKSCGILRCEVALLMYCADCFLEESTKITSNKSQNR